MAKNVDVGNCECPFKGCALVVPVFKFRQRSDDPKKRRMGGKLYGDCPTHGRFIDQEWLLEKVKWHEKNPSSGGAPVPPAQAAPATPVKPSEKTAPAPAKSSPVTASKSPATPVKPATQEARADGFFSEIFQ